MKTPRIYRCSIALSAFLITTSGAANAHAGPMFVYLVVDPTTTAGAGVPAVNSMTVTSSRSGAGSWHLYAVDDSTTDFGIRNYSITLSPGAGGSIPAIN